MAKGKKTGGRDFEVGHPPMGNAGKGPPLLDPIIKQIRELDRQELTGQFSQQIRMTKDSLREVIANNDTPIKDLIIAKAILKALETGDFRYVQPYIEYIFGKPKQIIDHSGELTIDNAFNIIRAKRDQGSSA